MKRNILLAGVFAVAVVACVACNNANGRTEKNSRTERNGENKVIETILSRKSVRKFSAQTVEKEKVALLLRAAMAAPSSMDRRPWELVVVDDRAVLDRLAEAQPYSGILKGAPMAIVVCGNTQESSKWYLDCSAAAQNILLAAESLGLGAVWTAAYPSETTMKNISEAIKLPEVLSPLCVIPIGYPDGEFVSKNKYNPEKVHYNSVLGNKKQGTDRGFKRQL